MIPVPLLITKNVYKMHTATKKTSAIFTLNSQDLDMNETWSIMILRRLLLATIINKMYM